LQILFNEWQQTENAHVVVLVGCVSRSDLPKLTRNDGGVNLRVSLGRTDHFLTIAITDSRKTVTYNSIILGGPRLE
jgi:hypothetical protein